MFFNNTSYQNSPTLSNHIVSFITCLRGETLPKIKSNPLFYNPVTKQSKYSQNLNKKKTSNQNNLPISPNILNPNIKYTIFTCKNPCKSLIVSNKPLKGSSINKAFQNEKDLFEFHQTILNETSLLQYDKIYNETHNFDKIYNENIKDCIINLFKKKNTCVFFFGPKNSGKSYLLRGSNDMESNEKGLLSRSVDEIFDLIDLTKQVNNKEEKNNEQFLLKISFLEVFMDDAYDLLSPKKKEKKVKIEKYYEDNQIKVDIIPIQKKILNEKNEFEGYMKYVMTERKKLQKKLKIDSLNNKGHLIISLYIEKINEENKKNEEDEENNENDNYYSQIDFVELASNDFGEIINFNNEFDNNNNNLLAQNTNKVFNSVANNIICNSQNLTPKNESKVTLCLKNTLNYNSNCIFFNNVIPWEFPLKLSLKSLKFTNWIRNQIRLNVDMKLVDDRNNVMDNNNNIEDNYYKNDNIEDDKQEKYKNLYNDNNDSNYEGTNNDNDYNNNYNYDNLNNNIPNKSINLNNFNNNNNEIGEKYMNSSNVLYKNQNPNLNNNFNNSNNNTFNNSPNNNDQPKYINKINNYNIPNNAAFNSYDENDENDLKILRNRQFNNNNNINNNNLNDINNNNNNNNTTYQSTQSLQNHFSPDDKNYKKLNKSLKDLQNKSFEINKNIKNLKSQSLQNNYSNNNPQFSINDEMATLKSDNIMLKEDINRLNNINKQLENNINQEQNKNFEILNDNEKICKENCELKKIINELQNKKKEEETYEEKFNAKVILQKKLNETENELKQILDEKEKYEIEYKILLQKFNELQKDYSCTVNEINCLNHNRCKEMNQVDNKLNNMINHIKNIENENFLLKSENEKLKSLNCDLEKNVNALNFYLNEEKNKNEILSKKMEEIERDFKKILIEKENENYLKMKEEEMKKSKIETKAKIINDLQNQIQNYKNQRLIKKRERDNNNSNDS